LGTYELEAFEYVRAMAWEAPGKSKFAAETESACEQIVPWSKEQSGSRRA